jgi:hypothetical protein
MVLRNISILVKFNLITHIFDIFTIGTEQTGYSAVYYSNGKAFMTDAYGKSLIIWDEAADTVDKIKLNHESMYSALLGYDGKIIRVPYKGEMVYEILAENANIQTINLKIEKKYEYGHEMLYSENSAALYASRDGDKLCVYSMQEDALCIFDKYGTLCEKYDIAVSECDWENFIRYHDKRIDIFYNKSVDNSPIGEEYIYLPCFLKYISAYNSIAKQGKYEEGKIGENIYKIIKGDVI